jgi:tripeptide aminopeptidase
MRSIWALLGFLLAGEAGAADASAARPFETILKDVRVQRSLRYLRDEDAQTLREQIEITQIPAPSFEEQRRADDYAARLRATGLTDVSIDAAGNVIGKRKGKSRAPLLVLSAHLDTVFTRDANLTVTQKDGRHYAPGIMDNARGLSAVLSVLRAMQNARIETVGDVWFVGTVGEEALGNLKGVKALFADHPHIDGFVSVDGVDSPRDAAAGRSEIVNRATGSRRWEITMFGPGGHSYNNFGTPSATHALGRAIAKIADLKTPGDPKTTFNVGVVSGGNGITAIAAEAAMRVDIRSDDAQELEALEQRILAAVDEAVIAENARWASQGLRSERKLIGDRPASTRAAESSVAEAAVGAHVALKLPQPALTFGSTDSNVPLGLGIPAATLNGGGRGDKAHSLDEWYEHVNAWQGPQTILLTTLRLAGIQGVSKPALKERTN